MKVITRRDAQWYKSVATLLLALAVTGLSFAHYHTRYRQQRVPAFSLHEERDDSGYSAAERLMLEGVRSGACDGWQPPSTNDTSVRSNHSGCWKDRWYAQLRGVLDNWEEFSNLSFTGSHWRYERENRNNLQRLLFCLPHYSLPISPDAPEQCQQQNALTVVLSVQWYLELSRGNGGLGGEVVHLRPITQTLDRENYTILTLNHRDYAGLVRFASALPDVITTIWAEDKLVVSCMADPRCRSDFPQEEKDRLGLSNVQGHVPAWKMVTPTFWCLKSTPSWEWGQREGDGFTFNTLSNDWILSPYAYPGHHHIPFSLEDACASIPLIPNRERKDQAVILGKISRYFYPERNGVAPPPEWWADFEERTGIVPIANAKSDNAEDVLPPGILNKGPLSFDDYTSEVGHAKMMIGLGYPIISPSPYLAICKGVPVLLPYSGETPTPAGYDLYDGKYTQHGPAALLGEPYVYSYNLHNVDSFYAAVEKARNNPIEPYFPEEMRLTNIQRLTLQLVNRDAEALAQKIQSARRAHGKPVDALVPDYVVKTIQRNGWLTRLREDGTVSTELGGDGLGYSWMGE